MQQKKTFDPRNTSVTNPFVQAYLTKQEEKSKPLSERQKLINVVLLTGMVLNLCVMGVVAWSLHSNSVARNHEAVSQEGEQAFTMGEAMERVRNMEATIVSMRNSVELHKNAYYKLEQEHESLKTIVAQVVPAGAEKDVMSNYSTSKVMTALPNPQLDSADAQEALRKNRALQEQAAQDTIALKSSLSGAGQ